MNPDEDVVHVALVGGSCDGGRPPVPRSGMGDEAPGFDFIPEDGSACRYGFPRLLHTADPDERA